jgi:hypothetical protein
MWRCVDVVEEYIASIFREENSIWGSQRQQVFAD